MQRMLSNLKQALSKTILVFGLISLLSFSGLFLVQPSYAATSNQTMDKESQIAEQHEQAYEEQLKAEKDIDKVYEENLKEYRQENPGEGIVEKAVEGAEKVVEKVTGK